MLTLPDLPYSGATMPVHIFEMLLENTQATRYDKKYSLSLFQDILSAPQENSLLLLDLL